MADSAKRKEGRDAAREPGVGLRARPVPGAKRKRWRRAADAADGPAPGSACRGSMRAREDKQARLMRLPRRLETPGALVLFEPRPEDFEPHAERPRAR